MSFVLTSGELGSAFARKKYKFSGERKLTFISAGGSSAFAKLTNLTE